MSAGSMLIGLTVSGLAILYLLSTVILLSFREKKDTYQAAAVATVLAYGTAVFWAGYMLSTPDNPMYKGMLVGWFLPFLVILAANLVRVRRRLAKGQDSR